MNWTDIENLDIDQAAQAVWENNHTRTRLETVKAMLAGQGAIPDTAGYRNDGNKRHQMTNLGPYAERVVARILTKGDNVAVRAPDNNNARDIYLINNGRVLDHGAQVKLGDPNEHIFYSLRKRLAHGHRDTVILDGDLVEDGKLSAAFTPYKRNVLQSDLERAGVRVVGVPGLLARAETERGIQAPGYRGLLNRVKRVGQDLVYRKEISL